MPNQDLIYWFHTGFVIRPCLFHFIVHVLYIYLCALTVSALVLLSSCTAHVKLFYVLFFFNKLNDDDDDDAEALHDDSHIA